MINSKDGLVNSIKKLTQIYMYIRVLADVKIINPTLIVATKWVDEVTK